MASQRLRNWSLSPIKWQKIYLKNWNYTSMLWNLWKSLGPRPNHSDWRRRNLQTKTDWISYISFQKSTRISKKLVEHSRDAQLLLLSHPYFLDKYITDFTSQHLLKKIPGSLIDTLYFISRLDLFLLAPNLLRQTWQAYTLIFLGQTVSMPPRIFTLRTFNFS
jgi:hypothetical protein